MLADVFGLFQVTEILAYLMINSLAQPVAELMPEMAQEIGRGGQNHVLKMVFKDILA